MKSGVLFIFTALRIEATAVAGALHLGGSWNVPLAAENFDSLVLAPVGIGCARANGFKAFGAPVCGCAILAGFAGALDPSLKIGDVVLDDCPAAWSEGFAGRRGKIVSKDAIIATAAQKTSLFRETGALAVDMESDLVRQWATKSRLPFVSIRVISDTADQNLNPALLQFIDELGNVKPRALTAGLLRQPALLPQLLRLGFASKLAGRNLGTAVAAMVQRITRTPASHET